MEWHVAATEGVNQNEVIGFVGAGNKYAAVTFNHMHSWRFSDAEIILASRDDSGIQLHVIDYEVRQMPRQIGRHRTCTQSDHQAPPRDKSRRASWYAYRPPAIHRGY